MDGKVYKRALVTCIAMLLLSIVFKLFGVQWFDLNTNIFILQEIDRAVMNNTVLSFFYSFTLTMINGYLICIVSNKQLKLNYVGLITICIASVLLSYYFSNSFIVFLFDFFSLYLICCNRSAFKEYLLVMILNVLYQIISLFIRNLGIQLSYYDVVCSILFMIDYYIMLILTYLYLKKGEKDLCSITQAFYSYLASKLWRKPSENYLNKDGK